MKKVILLTLLFFLRSYLLEATDYFVSTSGSNSNSGLSVTSPIKTIDKVNALDLQPGDRVLFKRGDVWQGTDAGTLYPVSGNIAGYITYAGYGSAGDNKPLLTMAVAKSNSSNWTDEGNNIWRTGGLDAATIGPELLANPSFDTDTNSWSLYTESGAVASGDRTAVAAEYDSAPGGAKIVVATKGAALNHIQLVAAGLSVVAGKCYKLTFRAKATSEFSVNSIDLMEAQAPWLSYATLKSKTNHTVNDQWNTYFTIFKCNKTDANGRITFYFGESIPSGTTFYLDTLSFKEVSEQDLLLNDVGNVMMAGKSKFGVKVWAQTDLTEQGEYWYDIDNAILKMFSTQNPATFYGEVLCAIRQGIIDESDKNYIIYDGLHLSMGAAHAIGGGNTHHIVIRNCDFSYIGGGDLYQDKVHTIRYGNGIEFWNEAHDTLVEKCRLWEIYDAALTTQGFDTSAKYNQVFRNNIIWNAEFGFEFWHLPESSTVDNIHVENNTFTNCGKGWGHAQRPDPNGRAFMSYYNKARTTNFILRNNIFMEATEGLIRIDNNWLSGADINYNCYYNSSNNLASLAGSYYSLDQFDSWKTATGGDAYSLSQEPNKVFIDFPGQDFRLKAGSSVIDAGIVVGVADDIAGTARPQGAGWDIGAYEYVASAQTAPGSVYSGETKIYAFPNPFRAGKESVELKYCVSQDKEINWLEIKIFNLAGELIYEFPAVANLAGGYSYSYQWDGKTTIGEFAASGIYIFVIDSNLGIVKTKIALLR